MQTMGNVGAAVRYDLTALPSDALLAGARRLVGTSNQLFADLLAHLAEVEARGVHRTRACASLYTYCIYELRFSEDAAFRRVGAARLARRFPAIFEAVATGELHLTGLLLIGPHLTQANHLEILARAKHRTKRELTALIRQIDPLPNVAARIEPLGPTPDVSPRPLRAPTWEQAVTALNPVRNLTPGERPRDWVDEAIVANYANLDITHDELAPTDRAAHNANASRYETMDLVNGLATNADSSAATAGGGESESVADADESAAGADEGESAAGTDESESATDEGMHESAAESAATLSWPIKGPLRYAVQFTATEEYVHLVERAKALTSQTSDSGAIAELHLQAMRVFVAHLEKRKYALPSSRESARPPIHQEPRQRGSDDSALHRDAVQTARQRGRHIPAAVRRAVYQRDEARCTFVDAAGHRCRETSHLELHHRQPFATGGQHTTDNVTLHCHAHNALCAEQDFGPLEASRKLTSQRHEPSRPQRDP